VQSSAKDDKLETIKAYVLNAAHKQVNQDTVVTALADGGAELLVRYLSSNPIARD